MGMSDLDGQVLSFVMLEGPLKSNCLLSIVCSSVGVTKYTLIGLELNFVKHCDMELYTYTCSEISRVQLWN